MVPILSQKDSSFSSFLGKTGVRGDFGRGEDIALGNFSENKTKFIYIHLMSYIRNVQLTNKIINN